ncbi:MAG TPA: PhzF family phenazine biosynthesis protein [Thermohalobaculum sp.]|nr:PhzF family phenazine biosynthesis protein [Thermohalobaculum sp.]
MATDYPFMWVDAFTDTAMGGNPCAAVFDADDISVDTRIAYVRETGLVECAYLQRSGKADFGARYYMADKEILLAGHPTIATCAALEKAGLLAGRDSFTLEVGAGVIPIDIARGEGATIFTMTQFAPVFGREYPAVEIAELLGLAESDILGTPQTVSTGTAFCVTRLRDHDALRRAKLDLVAFAAIKPSTDFNEPFLCVTEGFTGAGDTSARMMMLPPLPAEDPFTGSATGCMACYLWAKGLIDAPIFVAEQGHWMGRPGRAQVEVLGPRDGITGVRVGGSGVVLMDGRVRL